MHGYLTLPLLIRHFLTTHHNLFNKPTGGVFFPRYFNGGEGAFRRKRLIRERVCVCVCVCGGGGGGVGGLKPEHPPPPPPPPPPGDVQPEQQPFVVHFLSGITYYI